MTYTVAVLRRSAYDEIVEENGWMLARKGNGYIALRSQMPVRWTENGVSQGEGLIADGRSNIWICQLGHAAVAGSFSAWAERIVAAPLSFDDLAITYAAPGVGEIRFSWDGPFAESFLPNHAVTSGPSWPKIGSVSSSDTDRKFSRTWGRQGERKRQGYDGQRTRNP